MASMLKPEQSSKKEFMLETGIVEYREGFYVPDIWGSLIQIIVEPEVSPERKAIIIPAITTMFPGNKATVLYDKKDVARIAELDFYRELSAHLPEHYGSMPLEEIKKELEADFESLRADYDKKYNVPLLAAKHIIADEEIEPIDGICIAYRVESRRKLR